MSLQVDQTKVSQPGKRLKISQLQSAHLCVMIYGDNGEGKTHLAFTMPGRKLFINAHGNLETLLKFDKPPYSIAKDGPNGWEAVDWPRNWQDQKLMFLDPYLKEFDVIIGDNFTGAYRYNLEEVLRGANRDNPEIQDYGLVSERLRILGTKFRELRDEKQKHVIVVCHTMAKQDEETQTLIAGPSVPGQVPAHITSMFPELIFMKNQGAKRVAYLAKMGVWPAATRVLPSTKYENPVLAEMYYSWLNEREQELAKEVIAKFKQPSTQSTQGGSR